MSASDHLNEDQFFGVPGIHLVDHVDDNPAYWNTDRRAKEAPRTERRMLSPEHELHTTQDWIYPNDENVYIKNPSINGTPYGDGGQPGDNEVPHVVQVPGVGDVIGHGHHRLVAGRVRHEPVPVDYTRAKK